MDDDNREILDIEIDTSLPALWVIRVVDKLVEERGYPVHRRLENGPEFISQELAVWATEHKVHLAFIEPGKPTHNVVGLIKGIGMLYAAEYQNSPNDLEGLFHAMTPLLNYQTNAAQLG